MADLRTAAQQALAFIRWSQFGECRTDGWDGPPPTAHEVDAALRAALAEPAQEPVATVTSETGADISMSWWHEPALPVGTPLYAAPPQRKPLTDEEIEMEWSLTPQDEKREGLYFARRIERAHGIGGSDA